jgi:hypothetical protein
MLREECHLACLPLRLLENPQLVVATTRQLLLSKLALWPKLTKPCYGLRWLPKLAPWRIVYITMGYSYPYLQLRNAMSRSPSEQRRWHAGETRNLE